MRVAEHQVVDHEVVCEEQNHVIELILETRDFVDEFEVLHRKLAIYLVRHLKEAKVFDGAVHHCVEEEYVLDVNGKRQGGVWLVDYLWVHEIAFVEVQPIQPSVGRVVVKERADVDKSLGGEIDVCEYALTHEEGEACEKGGVDISKVHKHGVLVCNRGESCLLNVNWRGVSQVKLEVEHIRLAFRTGRALDVAFGELKVAVQHIENAQIVVSFLRCIGSSKISNWLDVDIFDLHRTVLWERQFRLQVENWRESLCLIGLDCEGDVLNAEHVFHEVVAEHRFRGERAINLGLWPIVRVQNVHVHFHLVIGILVQRLVAGGSVSFGAKYYGANFHFVNRRRNQVTYVVGIV